MHSSVKHLHTRRPLVPHGQLCQALPAWGSAKEGMGWANTVRGCCSWQNEGSGAGLASAKLSALDHLASQLQRDQQILQLCPQTRARHPWAQHREITGLDLQPHRQRGGGSKNNCLYPSLLILPLFHPPNLPSRTYSVNQGKWLWKLKYLRCNHCLQSWYLKKKL